jgi:Methyltransferase domain
MFTHLIDGRPEAASADAAQRFALLLKTALVEGRFIKLLLSKHSGAEEQLERLTVREVLLRGERQLSFLWRYRTKDITKNHPLDEGLDLIAGLLGSRFQNAHLLTQGQEIQLAFSRKGKPSLRVGKVQAAEAVLAGHDKEKQRYLELDRPFWVDLGVTHEVKGERQLVPAMSRKWKQINKFIEVMTAALKSSPLADSPDVHVADFGSGKGYLTFAMHDWLTSQGKAAHVTGVELRDDMVRLCGTVAAKHGMDGLCFDQGDVRSYTPARLDVMIALHACDIATDYAIHLGLRAKAAIIMCSPCCHKQLRPQMQMPPVLRPLLQHGIHLGQEAEMVTDSLRALLLEAEGYETQVFEFIALEHTSKNKMILAVKKSGAALAAAEKRRPEVLAQIAEIKRFYGLREQCLETLILNDSAQVCVPPASGPALSDR